MSDEAQAMLNEIIDAWESLGGGYHSAKTVEKWMGEDMAPAIDKARWLLKRKRPSGSEPYGR